jgi:hypothetical protein
MKDTTTYMQMFTLGDSYSNCRCEEDGEQGNAPRTT